MLEIFSKPPVDHNAEVQKALLNQNVAAETRVVSMPEVRSLNDIHPEFYSVVTTESVKSEDPSLLAGFGNSETFKIRRRIEQNKGFGNSEAVAIRRALERAGIEGVRTDTLAANLAGAGITFRTPLDGLTTEQAVQLYLLSHILGSSNMNQIVNGSTFSNGVYGYPANIADLGIVIRNGRVGGSLQIQSYRGGQLTNFTLQIIP